MSTLDVTDDTFETEVLGAEKPVLVDFWAEWCGPCKLVAPILDQIADEMGDRLTVAKLNIEDSPMTPGRYGVLGIPTMMLFKDGQMTAMMNGNKSKKVIETWLNEAGV